MTQPSPQTQDGLVGQLIQDQYEVEALIAKGGMGSIYRARHQRLGRPVAVKVLKRSYSEDEKAVKRFLREALAVSQLHHPHTVQVMDSGQTPDGIYYIVMEHLEGESLDRRIARDKTLSFDTCLTFVGQACAALGEAHRKGIVHRDLKPANIFIVRADGVPEFVKLLDFGIAKFYNGRKDGQELTKLTTAGSTMGTPHYMAPEQIRGEEIDGRADIYSIGIILWESLTGKPPYDGDSPMEIFLAHLEDKLPKLSECAGGKAFPHGLEKILKKALSKEPVDRYSTMEELKRDLDGLLFKSGMFPAPSLPISAPGGSPRVPRSSAYGLDAAEKQAATRPSISALLKRKSSLAIVVASVVLLVLVIAIIVVASSDTQTTEASEDATKRAGNAAPNVPASSSAHIKIHSFPPGADIFVAEERLGSTPIYLQYTNVSGAIRYEVRMPGRKTEHFTVMPHLGEVTGVFASLQREGDVVVDDAGNREMIIQIQSAPANARAVLIKDGKEFPFSSDGTFRLQAPASAKESVEVILRSDGFATERFRVPIRGGETVTIATDLIPLGSTEP